MKKLIFLLLALALCIFFLYGAINDRITLAEIQPLQKILIDRRAESIQEKLKYPESNLREKEKEQLKYQNEVSELNKKVESLQSQIKKLQTPTKSQDSVDHEATVAAIDAKIIDIKQQLNRCSEKIESLKNYSRELDERYHQTETVSKNVHKHKNNSYSSQTYTRRQTSFGWLDYKSMKNKNDAEIKELEAQQSKLDRQLEKLYLELQNSQSQLNRFSELQEELQEVLREKENKEFELKQQEKLIKDEQAVIDKIKNQIALENTPDFQKKLGAIEVYICCHSLDSDRYARQLLKVASDPSINNFDELIAALSIKHYKIKSRLSSSDFRRRRNEIAAWLGLRIEDGILTYSDLTKVDAAYKYINDNYRKEKTLYRKVMDAIP